MVDYDDRIDKRVERHEKITLKCNICGALFRTKNIEYIGARSIFQGVWNIEGSTFKAMECDAAGHQLSDLRLLTDEEFVEIQNMSKEEE